MIAYNLMLIWDALLPCPPRTGRRRQTLGPAVSCQAQPFRSVLPPSGPRQTPKATQNPGVLCRSAMLKRKRSAPFSPIWRSRSHGSGTGLKRKSRGSEGGGYGGVAVTPRNLLEPGSSRTTPPSPFGGRCAAEGWSLPRDLSPQHGCARGTGEVLETR